MPLPDQIENVQIVPAERGSVRNPKQRLRGDGGDAWRFYAAYSFDFIRHYLRSVALDRRDQVFLDPWNGSGSTTTAAWCEGITAIGIDLNPVMTTIGNARVQDEAQLKLVEAVTADVVRRAPLKVGVDEDDPLLTWFDAHTVNLIRSFQREVVTRFHDSGSPEPQPGLESVLNVILFRTVRGQVTPFLTSNPTWIRMPRDDEPKVAMSWSQLKAAIKTTAASVFGDLRSVRPDSALDGGALRPSLIRANASCIPLAATSIDHVVTSPPYGTRIDYAVATAVECAVLGVRFGTEFDNLRRKLTGSTKVPAKVSEIFAEHVGETCVQFLDAVCQHESVASSSYYLKNWQKYFLDIVSSIREISRVLRPEGTCTLIVQDSFYKDIRVPVQEIFVEMCALVELRAIDRFDFFNEKNLATINRRSRQWRDRSFATESVLVFEKL